jgi:hypothetical protein
MALAYRGMVNVVLIAADGSEYVTCFPAILNETMPGLFELSTPHKLPAARGSHTIRVILDDGQSLGGDVGYVGDFGLTFNRPQGHA